MTSPTGAPAPELRTARRRTADPARRPALLTLGVLVGVVLADQLTKGWAWQHLDRAQLNPGGTWFLGGAVSRWFAGGGLGAVLDMLSTQLIALGLYGLLRRPRPAAVLLPAVLALAGWTSNLLDRLGLHLLTAPGTSRGAVDFLLVGGCVYNLADVCIAVGTLGVVAGAVRSRLARRAAPVPPAPLPRPWRGVRRWALLATAAPLLLGTAASLTAGGGHLTAADAPVVQLLTGG